MLTEIRRDNDKKGGYGALHLEKKDDAYRLRIRQIHARGGFERMESKWPPLSDRISKNGSTALLKERADILGGP